MNFFLTVIGKFRHRIQHVEPSDPGHRWPTPILTYNVWLHASNQTASQRKTLHRTPPLLPPTSHSTTQFLPSFQHKMAPQPRLASLLILLLSIPPSPTLHPFSYFVTIFFIQLPLSITSFFLYFLKAWPSFHIWLMSPPLHKVLLNNHNLHSVIQIIQ